MKYIYSPARLVSGWMGMGTVYIPEARLWWVWNILILISGHTLSVVKGKFHVSVTFPILIQYIKHGEAHALVFVRRFGICWMISPASMWRITKSPMVLVGSTFFGMHLGHLWVTLHKEDI